MAVAATQQAAGAVGTAGTKAASAAAAAGGAAGGAAASGGSSSATTQAGVVVTAVVAVSVYAGLVVGKDGVSLICDNVTDASVLPGSMAIDFIGTGSSRLLTTDEAAVMGSTFVETYNGLFGCDSDYSRLIINCTIPCDMNSAPRQCCERLNNDPIYGEVLRCSFDCNVHCSGCAVNEPLFALVDANETSAPFSGVLSNSTADITNGNQFGRSLQSEACSSPQCLISKNVSNVVCGSFFNNNVTCVAARAFTLDSSVDDFALVEETPLIEAPSAQPSVAPSFAQLSAEFFAQSRAQRFPECCSIG